METQSDFTEQQVISTRKRRRTGMATAVETPLVVAPKTSSRTRNGCSSKAAGSPKAAGGSTGRRSSTGRNGHIGCLAENKRIVSCHMKSESSGANSSLSLEGPLTPSASSVNGFHNHEGETSMASQENDEKSSHENTLFPGLNDQLSLGIIALLPVSFHQPLKLVSRRWLRALSSSTTSANEVVEIRKLSGVTEQWVFLLASSGQHIHARWRAFDPVHSRWKWLPACPCDYTFEMCDKESAVAGTQLLVSGCSLDGPTIWRYDLNTNKWTKAPKMIQSRCLFASASLGVYAYFAGGSRDGECIKNAERYDSQSETWEPLPDLRTSRKWCSGCVLDGKFYVIGGQGEARESLTSGEYYDEAERRWVLVENMWPASTTTQPGQTAPPLVAVVNNELYAVDATTMELNSYQKVSNTWRSEGPVPYRSVDSSGWGMGFKAVQSEIFVIGVLVTGEWNSLRYDSCVAACANSGEVVWRQVCQLQQLNGFIYNCAVMTVC